MSVHSKVKATGQAVKAAAGQLAKNVTRVSAFQQDVSFYLPNPSDLVQKTIRTTKKFFEQDILAEVGVLLPDDAMVVDIGAGIGNSSLFFAKVTGAKVLAFEPAQDAREVLETSIALNNLEHQIELSNASVCGREGAGSTGSLDDVLGTRFVDLIRIDAAGLEKVVLAGAAEVLERCKPMLVARAATLEHLSAIEDVLRPYGYRKTRSFSETPIFLFEHGLEPKSEEETFTGNLLATLDGKLPKTTGIYAGMSSAAGNEAVLRAAVMSLLPQVDGLFLTLSGYTEVPRFLAGLGQVTCQLDPDGTRDGISGKLWGLGQIKDAVFLACDDCFLYPQNYVQRMTQALANCAGKSVLCVEGALILQPMADYHAKGARSDFNAEAELIRCRQVHVPRLGTCAFHSSLVELPLDQGDMSDLGDLGFAKLALDRQIAAHAVARKADWLLPLRVSQAATGPDQASCGHQNGEMPLSILDTNPASAVACLALEKDSNVLSALKDLQLNSRDPIVLIMCDAVTDDLRAKIAQSSYNWEIHLVPRSGEVTPFVQKLSHCGTADFTFWKVEKRRLVEDQAVKNLGDWLFQISA
ncbi:methyltransferase, FkbM family [Tritonibacter multivorans]|uniref:Methyltransferase, FkbM family n=1 Tax=Tritonibacter multivorans TaxID=928856 RepID=A0A0P1G0D1_9RHOB|nr:FkbM family methyltransferase [Tritonibacter multivorans]MDA7422426.1 FkbM family methyltransferase [Tritonibacter multivorans]CUH74963.1 methyltransferase, FkbM family [Tritonibacter multivorans]SFD44297.1 methyltransferase, FkbM family [Tritonibacter multivorans]